MGFKDLVKTAADKTKDLAKSEFEKHVTQKFDSVKSNATKQYKDIKNPNLQNIIKQIGKDSVDTVLVNTSATCNICSDYNQRIFSIYGRDSRFPQLHLFLHQPICSACNKNIQYYRYWPGINGKLDKDIEFSNRPFSVTHKQEEYIPSTTSTKLIPESSTYTEVSISEKKEKSKEEITFPDWYISVSFGKSTSDNYAKAVILAKSAPQYHEQTDDGVLLHQAIYSSKPEEFRAYLMLYETVGNWKSAFVMINGKLVDRKVIGKINYCYGDKCRIGDIDFCYGASYMTDNPFGCHRIQISVCNNPWWSFYYKSGNKWYLDKKAMKERIDSYANIYHLCPCFDYNKIISNLNSLPDILSTAQYNKLSDSDFRISIKL